MTKIKDIPVNERPIERLINNGANALSLEELLAILIKSGTKDSSAKMLASELLSRLKSTNDIYKLTLEDFVSIKGIGYTKAATLLAAIELSKRLKRGIEKIKHTQITNAEDVYNYYHSLLQSRSQEHFYCLYLDSHKKVLESKLLFLGTLNYSTVHPREVFLEAYYNHAVSIICVHNHPGGDPTPSKADIELTKKLLEIGKLMGVEIDDHIIIGRNTYYSFFEDGRLE